MPWLLSKLASAERSDSTFKEHLLKSEEESAFIDAVGELATQKNGMEVMWKLLASPNYEWTNSSELMSILNTPLMGLCARYVLEHRAVDQSCAPTMQKIEKYGRAVIYFCTAAFMVLCFLDYWFPLPDFRYLLQEKKRVKALDSVANFHLQNGAMVGRLNWMADRSDKGLQQSAGIMVNYIYRVENIEENAQSYFSKGQALTSPDVGSMSLVMKSG